MMRQPLTTLLSLAIVATWLQMMYTSISFFAQVEVIEKGAPRHLFASRTATEDHASTSNWAASKKFTSRIKNHAISASNWTAPKNFRLLPKKLITVFGLESSGTTLVADALAETVGAQTIGLFEGLVLRTKKEVRDRIEIEHISQPWGFFHDEGLDNQTVVDIDVLPPYECMVWPHYYPHDIQESCNKAKPHPRCFQETGLRKRIILPQRFMVNITSHIQWYVERGVEATAVIVVRDDYAHLHGKLRTHNKEGLHEALVEDMHAKELIVDAMQQLSSQSIDGRPPQIIVVSYETLMSLQEPYLFDLYERLGINSTYTPVLESGNKKYILAPNGTNNETWWNIDPGNFKVSR